ncbi:MAG: hypothetical protein H3C34_19670 [Caldilineaceae bacterium]|nr:hypothetical protein [Caldilineaceae bacterium]
MTRVRMQLPRSLVFWALLAALAIGLFLGVSLLSFVAGVPGALPGPATTTAPSPTPTLTSDVGAAHVSLPPPASTLEATVQAVVLEVLAALPTATPLPTADLGATATAQAQLIATAVGQARSGPYTSSEVIALWLSAVSAIAALLGVISTAMFSWRKDLREGDQARAELARTVLEVEKLHRELAQAQDREPPQQKRASHE